MASHVSKLRSTVRRDGLSDRLGEEPASHLPLKHYLRVLEMSAQRKLWMGMIAGRAEAESVFGQMKFSKQKPASGLAMTGLAASKTSSDSANAAPAMTPAVLAEKLVGKKMPRRMARQCVDLYLDWTEERRRLAVWNN
jgi:hypothetical protein